MAARCWREKWCVAASTRHCAIIAFIGGNDVTHASLDHVGPSSSGARFKLLLHAMMSLTAAKSALLCTSKRPILRTFASSSEKVWNVYLSGELFKQSRAKQTIWSSKYTCLTPHFHRRNSLRLETSYCRGCQATKFTSQAHIAKHVAWR